MDGRNIDLDAGCVVSNHSLRVLAPNPTLNGSFNNTWMEGHIPPVAGGALGHHTLTRLVSAIHTVD